MTRSFAGKKTKVQLVDNHVSPCTCGPAAQNGGGGGQRKGGLPTWCLVGTPLEQQIRLPPQGCFHTETPSLPLFLCSLPCPTPIHPLACHIPASSIILTLLPKGVNQKLIRRSASPGSHSIWNKADGERDRDRSLTFSLWESVRHIQRLVT